MAAVTVGAMIASAPKEAVVFNRVFSGVDDSPESLIAVRQAARLVSSQGRLVLTSVADVALAVHAGWSATAVAEKIVAEGRSALKSAHDVAPQAEALFLEGAPASRLLEAVEGEQADLVAVGTHGRSRAEGILLGSVPTLMLHEAPCSVLVARQPADPERFPHNICLGIDGSPSSALASKLGHGLAERFGALTTVVAACGGKKVNLDEVRAIDVNAAIDERPAVDALVERAVEAGSDLIVVGSRGLHGLTALGSVSERVAHRASCSVLVVRE
jgi:nucleotide-binding universal stress UspA family protein